MVIAFQIILLAVMGLSFFGVMGEREDLKLRDMMMGIYLASLIGFVVSVLWL